MCVQTNLEKNLLTSTNVVQKNFIGEKKFQKCYRGGSKDLRLYCVNFVRPFFAIMTFLELGVM